MAAIRAPGVALHVIAMPGHDSREEPIDFDFKLVVSRHRNESIAGMDLNDIVVFTKVAETKSFTGAADALGLPKSTVSRKLAQLEERLGVRLVQRTTRKLALTDIGEMYYERCSRIVHDVTAAEQLVTDMQSTPRGRLRISATVDFSTRWLGDIVASFLAQHPDINIELEGEGRNRNTEILIKKDDTGLITWRRAGTNASALGKDDDFARLSRAQARLAHHLTERGGAKVAPNGNHFEFTAEPPIERDGKKLGFHNDGRIAHQRNEREGIPGRLMLCRDDDGTGGELFPTADFHFGPADGS